MKMQAIFDACQPLIPLIPYLNVKGDDNLMSSVWLRGSFDKKEEWANGYIENSRYFLLHISPPKGGRWYEGGEVTAEVTSGSGINKFRKYTSTPEKVVAKVKQWIEQQVNR
jgi:hypothetical protein